MPMRVDTGAAAQKITYYDGLAVDIHVIQGHYKYVYNNSHRVCLHTNPEIGPARQGPGGNGGLGGPPVNDLNITILQFFPDLTQYSFVGNELIGGIMCQRFDTDKQRGTTGIMNDRISFYWDNILGKPVRWHMHSREKTFDAHTDEWFFDYIDFQPGQPSEASLALPHECRVDSTRDTGSGISAAEGMLAAAHSLRAPTTGEGAPLLWSAFVQEFGKTYSSQEEHERRRHIFDANVRTIQNLGQMHAATARFRGSYFLDMTREEMLSRRGGRRASSASREARRSPAQQELVSRHAPSQVPEALPRNFDWRSERPGSVSPVKDQGWCGSCWAFGLMEPVESITAIKTGHMTVLPEQFAVDCTWDSFNFSHGAAQDGISGCGGGVSDHSAFEIIRKFGGVVPSAEAYGAYLNVDGYCKDTRRMEAGATITGWVDIDPFDDHAVMDALVTQGPLSISIMVPDAINYYDTGVVNITECRCDMSQIDHLISMVGYGTDESNGLNYWLLRNSWSTYWGDEGYFKIARGELDCCVSSEAGYPTVAAVADVEVIAAPDSDLVVSFV